MRYVSINIHKLLLSAVLDTFIIGHSGKSMLARALCRQLNMPMLSITPSLLLRMYVGETPRLTKALFTLANKIQPCLLFIDETDSLFCARTAGVGDHAVDRKIITECE